MSLGDEITASLDYLFNTRPDPRGLGALTLLGQRAAGYLMCRDANKPTP
jgi:hypothetical protein